MKYLLALVLIFSACGVEKINPNPDQQVLADSGCSECVSLLTLEESNEGGCRRLSGANR